MKMRHAIATSMLLAALSAPAAAEPIIGLGTGDILYRFDSATPGSVTTLGAIAGLQASENLVGIDFRPANDVLYGLSDQSRLYAISLDGIPTATQIGVDGAFTLFGTLFGFDFNPVPDRIRVVSDKDQNLRLNPNDGTLTATDGTLAYAAGDTNEGLNPFVVAAAYTNSFAPSPRTPPPGTTLFVLDAFLNILARQDPPNAGTLNTVGGAGNVQDIAGFDISGVTGDFFASWARGALGDTLFELNPLGGAPTVLGTIGTGTLGIIDISVAQAVPLPGTLPLLALALGAFGFARRRHPSARRRE